jgi:hypothetical protein
VVSLHGGFVPAVRRRSLLALTLPEREDISRGIASGSSIRKIAPLLERAASTVSREVVRHGGRPEYRASEADQQAWKSALRPKPCLLAMQEKLQEIVASQLLLEWSPEQVYTDSLGVCRFLRSEFCPTFPLARCDRFLGGATHFIFLLSRRKRLTS